jgi:hypothetical protein
VQQAPGIPCALFFWANDLQTSGAMRREIAKLYPRHCERSEAIHRHRVYGKMDCFALLAMTVPWLRMTVLQLRTVRNKSLLQVIGDCAFDGRL